MLWDFKQNKVLRLIRNLILTELVVYGVFLALSIPFYWAKMYRDNLPGLAERIPFNVLELTGLALIQAVLIVLVVIRSLKEEASVTELIKIGEHERLEFKTTLRWDVKRGQVNKELEHGVMKTIAAFLNSKGGSLIIGVDDQHKVLGLASDFSSLVKKNQDGFENHFNNVFSAMIGPEFRRHVRLSFHEVSGEDVCLVSVEPGHQPAYLKTENGEDFFIRTGNATTPLKMSQLTAYLSSWRQR